MIFILANLMFVKSLFVWRLFYFTKYSIASWFPEGYTLIHNMPYVCLKYYWHNNHKFAWASGKIWNFPSNSNSWKRKFCHNFSKKLSEPVSYLHLHTMRWKQHFFNDADPDELLYGSGFVSRIRKFSVRIQGPKLIISIFFFKKI